MHYCNCGCIDENDVKKLASKNLRDLGQDDFYSYHGSALYTWGEIEHYKHFLPRILEVHNEKKGCGWIGLYEITSKLSYAQWENWEANEIKAIKDFIYADWDCFVNGSGNEISTTDIEYYLFFFTVKDLLRIWDLSNSSYGLKNFVSFFYDNGNGLLEKGLKFKDNVYHQEFKDFLSATNFLQVLEDEFFDKEEMENEYAEKVSVVIQMVEQAKSAGNFNN